MKEKDIKEKKTFVIKLTGMVIDKEQSSSEPNFWYRLFPNLFFDFFFNF